MEANLYEIDCQTCMRPTMYRNNDRFISSIKAKDINSKRINVVFIGFENDMQLYLLSS